MNYPTEAIREKFRAIGKLASFLKKNHPENVLMYVKPDKKEPVTTHKNSTWSWSKVEKYLAYPENEIAILLQDLIVIDIDCQELMKEYEERFPILKECPFETTSKGGHYYFKRTAECDELKLYDKAQCLRINGETPKFDFKTRTSTGTSGVIVCDPSTNKKWVRSLLTTPLPNFPSDFANYLRAHWFTGPSQKKSKRKDENITKDALVTLEQAKADLSKLKPDRLKYNHWTRIGWALSRTFKKSIDGFELFNEFSKQSEEHYDYHEARAIYFNEARGDNGLSYGFIKAIAKEDTCQSKSTTKESDSLEWKHEDIADIFAQDQGHMRLFVKAHHTSIVVVDPKIDGHCYIYHNITGIWQQKANIFIQSAIGDWIENYINDYRIHLCQRLKVVLSDLEKGMVEKDIKDVTKVLRSVRSSSRNTFMKVLTKLYSEDFESKLNKTAYLIPIQNRKVIDLRTGELLDRTKAMMFSFECPVSFTPNACLAKVERFFSEVMNGDQDMVRYFQKVLGYSITGEISERCLFICYGSGANGKGAVFETLKLILKSFYIAANKDVFIKANSKSHHGASSMPSPHLMDLKVGRMAVFSESEEGEELNEGKLKELTGGDTINARALFKNNESFISQNKLFLQTNHRPHFSHTQSMIDRIRYIPFNARFVKDPVPSTNERKADEKVKTWLRGEGLNSVFTWLVNGATDWYTNGFGEIPNVAKTATEEYLKDLDIFSNFVDARLVKDNTLTVKNSVRSNDLYVAYKLWCALDDIKPVKDSKFKENMTRKLGAPKRSKNAIHYSGWKLMFADEDSAHEDSADEY